MVRARRKCWCGERGRCGCGEYVGGKHGLGIVSSTADVLGMSVVWGGGMRRVSEKCLARDNVGVEWIFTNPVGTGGVLDVCLCLSCCGVGEE